MSVRPCPDCRKPGYSSYRVADRVRHRANGRGDRGVGIGSIYWCSTAGAWHVTGMERGEHDRQLARREAAGDRGYPQVVHNSGDNLGTPWGRPEIPRRPGENRGASSRNFADGRLEILPVVPLSGGTEAGQSSAAHPNPGGTARTPHETHPRLESEVTLPDPVRPLVNDTPVVDSLEPTDEVRPFDGHDDDYEYAS